MKLPLRRRQIDAHSRHLRNQDSSGDTSSAGDPSDDATGSDADEAGEAGEAGVSTEDYPRAAFHTIYPHFESLDRSAGRLTRGSGLVGLGRVIEAWIQELKGSLPPRLIGLGDIPASTLQKWYSHRNRKIRSAAPLPNDNEDSKWLVAELQRVTPESIMAALRAPDTGFLRDAAVTIFPYFEGLDRNRGGGPGRGTVKMGRVIEAWVKEVKDRLPPRLLGLADIPLSKFQSWYDHKSDGRAAPLSSDTAERGWLTDELERVTPESILATLQDLEPDPTLLKNAFHTICPQFEALDRGGGSGVAGPSNNVAIGRIVEAWVSHVADRLPPSLAGLADLPSSRYQEWFMHRNVRPGVVLPLETDEGAWLAAELDRVPPASILASMPEFEIRYLKSAFHSIFPHFETLDGVNEGRGGMGMVSAWHLSLAWIEKAKDRLPSKLAGLADVPASRSFKWHRFRNDLSNTVPLDTSDNEWLENELAGTDLRSIMIEIIAARRARSSSEEADSTEESESESDGEDPRIWMGAVDGGAGGIGYDGGVEEMPRRELEEGLPSEDEDDKWSTGASSVSSLDFFTSSYFQPWEEGGLGDEEGRWSSDDEEEGQETSPDGSVLSDYLEANEVREFREGMEPLWQDTYPRAGGGTPVVLGPHFPSTRDWQRDPRLAGVATYYWRMVYQGVSENQIADWLELPRKSVARAAVGAGRRHRGRCTLRPEDHAIGRFLWRQPEFQAVCGPGGVSWAESALFWARVQLPRVGENSPLREALGLTQLRSIATARDRQYEWVKEIEDGTPEAKKLRALLLKVPPRPPGWMDKAEDPARGVNVAYSAKGSKSGTRIFIDTAMKVMCFMALAYVVTHGHSDHFGCFDTMWFAAALLKGSVPFVAPVALVRLLTGSATFRWLLRAMRMDTTKIRGLQYFKLKLIIPGVFIMAFPANHCIADMSVFLIDATGAVPLLLLFTGDCYADAVYRAGLRKAFELLKEKFEGLTPARAVIDATTAFDKTGRIRRGDAVTRDDETKRLRSLVLEKVEKVRKKGKVMVVISSYALSSRYRLAVALARALNTGIYVAGAAGALYSRRHNLPELQEFYGLLTRDPTEALVHIVPHWTVRSNKECRRTLRAVAQRTFIRPKGVVHAFVMISSGYCRPKKRVNLCHMLEEMGFEGEDVYVMDGRDSVAFREEFWRRQPQ